VDRLPVVVVSADPLARAGLAALVSGQPDLALVGEASPPDASRRAAAHPGAALLVDLGAAGEGATALTALVPTAAPLVALAVDAAAAAEALRTGVRAVLLRGAPAAAISAALGAAARGLAVLDAAFAEAFVRAPGASEGADSLTAREREVLSLLAEGLGNRAIGARLGISEHTAKFHVNSILGKLGAGSRAEAVVRAVRQGLVLL
jgi:DNA-binding NarL/FixJ family response regulator